MALQLPPDLIAAVQEGRAVLFLGAGASRGAVDPATGAEIPDGRTLASILAEAFLGEEYKDLDLRSVYDLACSQRDVRTVQRKVFEILNPVQPAEFHLLVPTFAWAGIVTTNYDLVVERAYRNNDRIQKLVPYVKDGDGATDQLGDRGLLYVKVHGCITRYQETAPPLIASTEQLISFRNGRSGQFDTFLEWAKTKTIIFCGFAFLDSNLRMLFDEIIKEGDNRPRHYIINKGLRSAEIQYWSDRRAVAIDGTYKEFLEELDQKISKNKRALGSLAAASNATTLTRFITTGGGHESEDLRHYITSFIEHIGPELDPKAGEANRFYSGFDLGWYPIAADLDVRQPIVDDIVSEHVIPLNNSGKQSLVIVKGHAGSGKSVVLRRICYDAAKIYHRLCFFVSRQHIIQIDRFKEIFDLTNLPVMVFVDNISDHRDKVFELLKLAATKKAELKIIGAETFPIWNATCDELDPLVTQVHEMRYLSEASIRELVSKLEKHHSLGYLHKLSPDQRVHELKHVHGRQLLVALLEATHGTPLVEIVAQEYRSIPSAEARLLYLDICSLHRFGPPVRAGLISRIHNISFDDFAEKFFKPLESLVVLRKDQRSGDMVYEARHSYIAHTVYETAIRSEAERFDNIVRVLTKLNPGYSYDLEVISKLVKADTLQKVLSDHSKIRQVYDVADASLGTRALLRHQRGIFEMHIANNQGGLSVAERLLGEAESLEPFNRSIKHSLSELDLRRSRLATDPLERKAWRQSAIERAAPLMKGSSPYPHHTVLKAAIDAVRDALTVVENDTTEAATQVLGETIAHAEDVLKRGLQAFPNEAILLKEEGELSSVLSEAVRAEKAFEKAFAANQRSTLIAKRLARIKRAKGAFADAREILHKCLEFNPAAADIHYDLARTILDSAPDADQEESETIIYHLRRSFTPGDRNAQAQFWYARQLSIADRYEEAKSIFKSLSEAKLGFSEKKELRGTVYDAEGIARIFTGEVTSLHSDFGFLRCSSPRLDAFFSKSDLEDDIAELLKEGDVVRFNLTFNLMGPTAINLSV